MPRIRAACHRSVKLHHAEAVRFGLRKAVRHQLFTDVQSAAGSVHSAAHVGDAAAGADVVWCRMYIPRYAPGCSLFCRDGIGLRGKERRTRDFVRRFFLREGLAVFRRAIPDRVYLRDILRAIGAELNAESDRCILL